MAQCCHGRSVVTSDLSDSRPAAVTATRNVQFQCSMSQGSPVASVISHRPRSRAFHGQATTSTSQRTHRITFHAAPPECAPPFAFRTVSGSMDDSMALLNLRALAGRHLPFADTDRRRTQAPPTMGCNLWLLPVASCSSTIPLVHCSPRPRLCPYPRACLLLTSSSLLAEISALLAPLACRQRARKSPIFVLILRRVFQVESVKVRSGLEIPQSHGARCPPHPQASCRPVRASEMTPVHVCTVEGRGKKSPPSVAVYRCGSFPSCTVIFLS